MIIEKEGRRYFKIDITTYNPASLQSCLKDVNRGKAEIIKEMGRTFFIKPIDWSIRECGFND